mmetsp:Transcript_60990/g.176574  ORF Transcript_60990/g.176574 Transcript_60990/m.176574 type:complete len:352 (+) Transcript_60990:1290-2345(+)
MFASPGFMSNQRSKSMSEMSAIWAAASHCSSIRASQSVGPTPDRVSSAILCKSWCSCGERLTTFVSYRSSQSTSRPVRSTTVFSLNCKSPLLTLSMKLTNCEFMNFGLPLLRNISTIWAAWLRSTCSCMAAISGSTGAASANTGAASAATGAAVVATAGAGAMSGAEGAAIRPRMLPSIGPMGDIMGPPIMGPMGPMGLIMGPMGPPSTLLKAASISAARPCRICASWKAASIAPGPAAMGLMANSPAQSCGPGGRCIIIPWPGAASHGRPGIETGPSVKKPASRISAPIARCMCCASWSGIAAPSIGGRIMPPTSRQASSRALPGGPHMGSIMWPCGPMAPIGGRMPAPK